jgi:2-polyprenyl-3-methyl-5-hydroxy-6-metoxy-1,4-benzoquinol methylase
VDSTRYSYKIDLEQLNSSHSLAVLSVPPGSRVLDLGAADGSVARTLKERHCTVWGIERDERAAADARRVCDRVLVADLESAAPWQELGDETFDVILALDVLEHLREPAAVLNRALTFLKSDGIVVVSIPNIAHGAVRISLLEGRFDYTELGLLDRTHVRFFDRRGAERLMADAGLVISEHLRVSRDLEGTEIPIKKSDIAQELLDSLARDPDSTTYQFVFVGRRAGGALPAISGMLSERLLAENEELRANYAEVEQYVRHLEAERAAALTRLQELELLQVQSPTDEVAELKSELEQRVDEAQRHRIELRHAKADLVTKQAYVDSLRGELQAELATKQAFVDSLRGELQTELAAKQAFVDSLRGELQAAQGQREQFRKLESELNALRIYANSAAFRIVERVIVRLKRVPLLFGPARAMVRRIARRRGLQK